MKEEEDSGGKERGREERKKKTDSKFPSNSPMAFDMFLLQI